MTTLLALDCTDRACSVAVLKSGEIIESYNEQPRQQARRILGQIECCLRDASLDKRELEAIVWCHGPGSFTGLRIAAACVQGLAFALNIPVIGISSMMAMALRAPEHSKQIWVGLDARMGEVYNATFQRRTQSGELEIVSGDRLDLIEELSIPDNYDCYLGNALAMEQVIVPDHAYQDPDAQIHVGDLLKLPTQHLLSLPAGSALSVEPVYLRRADAWKKMESR